MEKLIQILTTTGKKEEAEKIAGELVGRNLSGCVQIIGPVESVYRWKNKIEKSSESICFIKTKKDLFKEVENLIKEISSYEVPEIIEFQITDGSKDYLTWLKENLR